MSRHLASGSLWRHLRKLRRTEFMSCHRPVETVLNMGSWHNASNGSQMNAQQILVYSDSLTRRLIPNTRQRLPFESRWPGVMELV